MSKAYRCDKCGEWTDGKPAAFVEWQSEYETCGRRLDQDSGSIDLCVECAEVVLPGLRAIGVTTRKAQP